MIYSKSSMFTSWFGSSFLKFLGAFFFGGFHDQMTDALNRIGLTDLISIVVLEVDMRRQQVEDDQNVLSDQTKLRRHGGGQCVSHILGRDIPNTLAGKLFPRWCAKYPVAQ